MAIRYEPGTRVSEYLLEERIGVGSFGEVWRARHHVWDNDYVAIKLPTEPEYVRYLQREGVVVHGLKHPNIVRVVGLDPYGDTPYLVMELVRGPSLKQVIEENPQGLSQEATVAILEGVLEGLIAAHGSGVLHRDLKPGNILLNVAMRDLVELTSKHVKLVDFGLGVKNVDALRSIVQSASIDRDNKLVGTLAYMAPEVRDGRQADARADLYALGVILFEMLTGERPAGAERPSTLNPTIPAILDEIFERLYARYDRRYESAEAARDDLKLQLGGRFKPAALGGMDILVHAAGPQPIELVKLVREAKPHLTLAGARDFIGKLPRPLLEGIDLNTAQRWKERLEDIEARVTIVAGRSPQLPRSAPPPPLAGAKTPPPIPGSTLRGTCRACDAKVDLEDQFCTQCGAQLAVAVRRCKACGAFPGVRDQFCIFCGAGLSQTAEV